MLLKGSGVAYFAYFHNQGTCFLSLQSISKSTPLPTSLKWWGTAHFPFLPETKKSILCDVKVYPDIHDFVISDHYFFSQTQSKILGLVSYPQGCCMSQKFCIRRSIFKENSRFLICFNCQNVPCWCRLMWTSWAAGNNILELIWGPCGILRNSCDPKPHLLISAQHVHGVCYHKEVKLSQ